MTGRPPILVMSKTGRVYVITHYTFHSGGECIPLVKYDVTGQFEYICQRRSAEGSLSPPAMGAKVNQDSPSPL